MELIFKDHRPIRVTRIWGTMGYKNREKSPKEERLRARAPLPLKRLVDAFLNYMLEERGIEMSESDLVRAAVRDYIKRNAPDLYLESMNQTTLEVALTEEVESGVGQGRRGGSEGERVPDKVC